MKFNKYLSFEIFDFFFYQYDKEIYGAKTSKKNVFWNQGWKTLLSSNKFIWFPKRRKRTVSKLALQASSTWFCSSCPSEKENLFWERGINDLILCILQASVKAFVVLSSDFKNKEQDEMIKELQDYVTKKTGAWMSPRKVSYFVRTSWVVTSI